MRIALVALAILLLGGRATPQGQTLEEERGVVINELMYHPKSDRDEDEYLELHNRGGRAIELSGWRFVDGIEFTFPAGTAIEPGAYLVVAKDAEKIAETKRIDEVVGNYAGVLSDRGETITLVNVQGETIDSITYSDRAPFPSVPDGDGASLERVNPFEAADLPGNWRASLGARQWIQVSATGNGTSSNLYFHLTDQGILNIDDVELVDQGTGENVLANGGFEEDATGWSGVGTHQNSRRASSTVSYPAHSGRYSYQVRSSGPGDPATDYAGVFIIPFLEDRKTYRLTLWLNFISGRATRLIFGLQGGGILGEVAIGEGTAGARNSSYREDLPAQISEVAHYPEEPASTEPVSIVATIRDNGSIQSAEVAFRVGSLTATDEVLPMLDDGEHGDHLPGDGIYGAVIEPAPNRTIVFYQVRATDDLGQISESPIPGEPTTHHGYFVFDGGINTQLPICFWIIAPGDVSRASCSTQVLGHLVFDGVVYPNVKFRHRGQTACGNPKKHWHVNFNKDHRFPAHGEERTATNFQSMWGNKDGLRHLLAYEHFAGIGHAHCFMEHVRVELNNAFYGLYVHMEHPNEAYLRRNGLDPEGELFKMYTESKGPGGWMEQKAGDPFLGQTLLNNFLREVNMSRSAADTMAYIEEHMNVEAFTDYLVMTCLVQNADHPAKNYFWYRYPETDRWTMLPWDLDLALGRNFECSGSCPGGYAGSGGGVYNDCMRFNNHILLGTQAHPKCDGPWNGAINKFLTNPVLVDRYYERLREVLDTYFKAENFYPRIEELRSLIRADMALDRARWRSYGSSSTWNFDTRVNELKDWYPRRIDFLAAQVMETATGLTCSADPDNVLHLEWENKASFRAIRVYLGGRILDTIDGESESYVSEPVSGAGRVRVCLAGIIGTTTVQQTCCEVELYPSPPLQELSCEILEASEDGNRFPAARLGWKRLTAYDEIRVYVDTGSPDGFTLLTTAPGDANGILASLADLPVEVSTFTIGVTGIAGGLESVRVECAADLTPPPLAFVMCTLLPDNSVDLIWATNAVPGGGYDHVVFTLNGEIVAQLDPDSVTYTVPPLTPSPKPHVIEGHGEWFGRLSEPLSCQEFLVRPERPFFVRGDADADGRLRLADAVAVANVALSGGMVLPCLQAGDADANGILELDDALGILRFIFARGSPPSGPFPECGMGEEANPLPCERFPVCE